MLAMLLIAIACFGDLIFWTIDDDLVVDLDRETAHYIVMDADGNIKKEGNAKSSTIFMSDNHYYFDATGFYSPQYYFAIELINFERTGETWTTEAVSYNDLVSAGAVRNIAIFNTKYYSFSSLAPVASPEPSSGLLLLVGAAFLCLRRHHTA